MIRTLVPLSDPVTSMFGPAEPYTTVVPVGDPAEGKTAIGVDAVGANAVNCNRASLKPPLGTVIAEPNGPSPIRIPSPSVGGVEIEDVLFSPYASRRNPSAVYPTPPALLNPSSRITLVCHEKII